MSKPNPSYFEAVFAIARQVPYGRVTTYGIIADLLALGSARMVGWALNKSFSADEPVPAHRVVNRKGELSGRHHFSPPEMMQELLEQEGVAIKNHQVVNFEQVLWDPRSSL